ncbi:abhydrolase domain-containing protein 4 [Platysternon megacephalum]|uniref:Abhydrolase domain-containing protein 4 n=1 Tax=Platysternon megacephalum TaxID=55544 RepID=A0A4D9DS56_9SAUR|nr:abhydrolase domain-containing protein 4 [Platysternon megacephalum]
MTGRKVCHVTPLRSPPTTLFQSGWVLSRKDRPERRFDQSGGGMRLRLRGVSGGQGERKRRRTGMGNFSDNAVVRATRTPPPELPKNQESALRSLTTQNSTRVQMKHPGSPNLIYVKPKDKTKDSGKKTTTRPQLQFLSDHRHTKP